MSCGSKKQKSTPIYGLSGSGNLFLGGTSLLGYSLRQSWREDSFMNQLLAKRYAHGSVHRQNLNRDSADWSAADDQRPVPAEMSAPFVSPGIE